MRINVFILLTLFGVSSQAQTQPEKIPYGVELRELVKTSAHPAVKLFADLIWQNPDKFFPAGVTYPKELTKTPTGAKVFHVKINRVYKLEDGTWQVEAATCVRDTDGSFFKRRFHAFLSTKPGDNPPPGLTQEIEHIIDSPTRSCD